MPKINNGGRAFPRPLSTDAHTTACNLSTDQTGMTLRDWFAGQALTGLIASHPNMHAADYATISYRVADAMIAASEDGNL